jgi:hypothetical protein
MCGALATSAPSGPNSAQLKSSLSLMLTDTEVRCRVRPICSAMPMKRWLKMDSVMGSHSVAEVEVVVVVAGLGVWRLGVASVEGVAGCGFSPKWQVWGYLVMVKPMWQVTTAW